MMAMPRRSIRAAMLALLAAGTCLAPGRVVIAADQSNVVTTFRATVDASSSLRVSDHLLVIAPRPVGYDGPVAAGTIDFRAGARAARDAEVLLTVEPLRPLHSLSGGAAEGTTAVGFQGEGDGAQAGVLSDARPEVVARWVGSGLRAGRVTFTVSGPLSPQGATLPLRFVLTAP